jgi:hypothetical protein
MKKTDTKPTHEVLPIRNLLICRGSSVVERRPEKAGVASSILAPGTTHVYHGLFSEKVHLALRSITKASALTDRRQGQFSKLFRHHSPSLVNALKFRDGLASQNNEPK